MAQLGSKWLSSLSHFEPSHGITSSTVFSYVNTALCALDYVMMCTVTWLTDIFHGACLFAV